MGAQSFIHSGEGYSANEYVKELVKDSIEQYGNDSYNGQNKVYLGSFYKLDKDGHEILKNRSPIPLFKKDTLDKWIPTFKSSKSLEDSVISTIYEQGFDEAHKREIYFVDLGIVGYDVLTVSSSKVTIPKDAKQSFIVKMLSDFGEPESGSYGSFEKEDKATEKAMQLSFETGKEYCIMANKVLSHKYFNPAIKKNISVSVKRVKKAPVKIKANQKIKAVHKYIVYGIAPS